MGTVELDSINKRFIIRSKLIFYGNMASPELADQCADEIMTMWNEPRTSIRINGSAHSVLFLVNGFFSSILTRDDVTDNRNPANNYFRVEEKVKGNISSVDGVNCNTGLFQFDNLYKNSTTAAHEYGHTIGLDHPHNLDLRGRGLPGIMYPRGTLVDSQFQYDPNVPAATKGGTLNPIHRSVLPLDIEMLQLEKLPFSAQGMAVLGDFSGIYH